MLFPLTEAGLQGMIVFVESMNQPEIKALEISQRNKLLQDGFLLESLYGSPGKNDMGGLNFDLEKTVIRNFRAKLQSQLSALAGVTPTGGFSACIEGLRRALESKGFAIRKENETDLVDKLNKWAGINRAPTTTRARSSAVTLRSTSNGLRETKNRGTLLQETMESSRV